MPSNIKKDVKDHIMQEILRLQDANKIIDLSNVPELFSELQEIEENWNTLKYLEAKGFITCIQNPVSHKLLQIRVTAIGTTYFEDAEDTSHEKRVESIRYWITTGIAVAAWITAIVSIILQYL